jgi:hypothetical protein
MKEKNKKVASGVTVFLLIWWEYFSCSIEMQQVLIFCPLCLLVLRAVAMLRPVCLYAVEAERHGCLDSWRKGVRWYSGCYPHRCRGIDVIMVE